MPADDRDYPVMIAETNRVEPAPRRVRALFNGQVVVDTTRAKYVWEWPYYPQYYIPLDDVATEFLIDEGKTQRGSRGIARRHGLRVGEQERPACVRVYGDDAIPGVAGSARFDWDALDAWYEEDEEIFVHPRNPYVRVDAVRSRRRVRIELDGVLLAESDAPVMLFETGLPTRYYVDRTDVRFDHLVPTDTVTRCPYKGTTSAYWSVEVGGTLHADLAWAYDHPTPQVGRIAGLVAFFNEKVDITVDGRSLTRPITRYSR